ncbi:hypothetical protein [Methylobacterium durans]|nr:hypothetical protein [Methylobacterium durans]
MSIARPFRWLLALVALVVPAVAASCRDAKLGVDGATEQAAASVVFRHYI